MINKVAMVGSPLEITNPRSFTYTIFSLKKELNYFFQHAQLQTQSLGEEKKDLPCL
jgi:hypothetical protein